METNNLLELISRKERYKMYIPKKVEEKIRLLLKEIYNIEWSGVLFYTVKGSFEDDSLEIHCEDILLMDVGNSTYTEWDMNTDVVNYLVDHPELMQPTVYQSNVHSHHSMTTTFSGTDINTLRKEGSDVNHFVSLIVNNAGTYNAAITRKVQLKNDIYSVYTYNSFDNTSVEGNYDVTECKEVIEYFYLDVIVEKVEDNIELHTRIKEIKDKKTKVNQSKIPVQTNFLDGFKRFNPYSPTEFKTPKKILETESLPKDYIKSKAKHLVKQIITCNILVPENATIDLVKWSNNMDNLYSKRFKDKEIFGQFAINYLDFIMYNSTPDDYPFLEQDFASELAEALLKEFDNLNINNSWIDEWEQLIADYII